MKLVRLKKEAFRNKLRLTMKLEMPPPAPPHVSSPRTHLLWFALTSTCIKLLLIPTYHSTDFEVHRNWLALTHSLPLSGWYVDQTSPWTLDYPPLFAYFERFLALVATLLDPQITHLHNGLNYNSSRTILFQRGSVIVMDFVLVYAVYRATKGRNLRLIEKIMVWAMVIWSPMLIIVDHVHFQYNGFLIGLLLISVSGLEEGRDLFGGFVFAVLICFKHLFAVAAPVYFVYLFRHYCRGGLVKGFGRFVVMGVVVLAVFVAAYGPFVYYGQVNFLRIALTMLISITFASVLLYSNCVSIMCLSSFLLCLLMIFCNVHS